MLRSHFLTILCLTGILATASQSAEAQCQTCQQCNDRDKCCRPNNTKIIVWRSNIVSGGLSPVMGGVPPQGFAVSSVPAVMVQQPAIAIHPASFSTASFGTAGLTTADLDAAVRRHAAATATANASGGSTTCQDPCGDILQLKQDVKDLKLAIGKITDILEKHQQSLPK